MKLRYLLRLNDLLVSLILLYFITSSTISSEIGYGSSCPCHFPQKEYNLTLNFNESYNVCILNHIGNNVSIPASIYSIKYLPISSYDPHQKCHMIFKLSKRYRRRSCPGICRPIPILEIPMKWLEKIPSDKNTRLTCSLDLQTISNISISNISELLYILFYRRLQECYEQKEWIDLFPSKPITFTNNIYNNNINYKYNTMIVHKLFPSRRKVMSLVIWVGTLSALNLLYYQMGVLNNFTTVGSNATVGWKAAEDLYGCRIGTNQCFDDNEKFRYRDAMPATFIGRDSSRNRGWACAQRRTLRVIAHTLLLYNPDIMIIGDDDTYINYPLIINKLKYIIHKKMKVEPIALGNIDFQPLISPSGFFHGGAGYIFSSALITTLVSNSIPDPIIEDKALLEYYMKLSILNDVRKYSKLHCLPYSCVLSEQYDKNGNIPIAVRLIDICTHLMSGEYTCHHRYVQCVFQSTRYE